MSERIFADAKVKHGLDRAQLRGRAKMQIQALRTATTMNVKRLIRQRPVPQAGIAANRLFSQAIATALLGQIVLVEHITTVASRLNRLITMPIAPGVHQAGPAPA